MLGENWRFYSERVDGLNFKKTRVRFSEHYAKDDTAMPLPATYAIDIADRISRNDPNMQARIFSHYPWPGREGGGPRDDFERRALEWLESEEGGGAPLPPEGPPNKRDAKLTSFLSS